MSADVVQLNSVKPKRLDKRYKNTSYVLEFDMKTTRWKWTVTYIHKTTFSDEAPTLAAAQRAAEKHIDSTLKLRGK